MENLKQKPLSFHQNSHSFHKTPLRPLQHSISLHKTSAGLKSRLTFDELPIINDFYLSELSTKKRTKQTFTDFKPFFNTDELIIPITKGNKLYDQLPFSLREFIFSKKEFMQLLDNFDKISYCIEMMSEKIKCYRAELGNLLEKSQRGFTNLFENFIRATINLFIESEEKSQTQMKTLLERITFLEEDKKALQTKNLHLKSLNNFQESEYKICKMNSDSLQSELVLLHDLLKKDISSLINHAGVIENVNQKSFAPEDLSEKLSNLNDLIGNLETEQTNKKNVIDSMNNLLKAMLKGKKCDVSTQVEEAELEWKAEMIIETNEKFIRMPAFSEIGSSCLNMDKFKRSSDGLLTNIEAIDKKQKEINLEFEEKDKTNTWSLPATLLVFLENTLKNHDFGRVLPWLHFKKSIYGVYNERIALNNEIKGGFLSNTISMDEFLCLYFIRVFLFFIKILLLLLKRSIK